MGFWGVEVKPEEPVKIKPKLFKIVNISQAALGEVKDAKGAEHVSIHLKVGDEKYVIGTLSAEDTPQLMLDLVFEREFELSHNWKHGSIYFSGYVSKDPSIDYEVERGISNEDEGNPFNAFQAGKLLPKVQNMKPKKEVPEAELDEDVDEDDDSDDGGESEELEEDSTDDSADTISEKHMDDSGDSDLYSDSDDLMPQKAESVKKRSSESARQNHGPSKKGKLVTPGNKANPSKKTDQTSENDKKPKEQNPQFSHQHSCKPCSKTFN